MSEGLVYILTNPCLEGWVKIGMTGRNDIERRLQELNAPTNIPLSFRCYAVYEVENPAMVEENIHSIIDQVDDSLHAREQLDNGRMREREFFKISPERAYRIFKNIAALRGDQDKLKLYVPTEGQAQEQALLVLPVAAFHLAVVSWRIGTDELVTDTQLGCGGLKEGGQIPPAVGETVCELKSVVGLDALHLDTPAGIPFEQLSEEIGRGIGGLLRVGSQEAQTGELVNGGVLVQLELRVRDALTGHNFHVHLDTLAGIGHLLVRLGPVWYLLLGRRKHPQLPHDPEQALRTASVAPFPQPVPQLHHAQVWVTAAQISDQLQLCLRVLVGMAVRPPGLAGQGLRRSIPAGFPEVDVRPALVVLSAGPADAVFLRILHQGLPIRHVLCYTLAHEGYGLLSSSCCVATQL